MFSLLHTYHLSTYDFGNGPAQFQLVSGKRLHLKKKERKKLPGMRGTGVMTAKITYVSRVSGPTLSA